MPVVFSILIGQKVWILISQYQIGRLYFRDRYGVWSIEFKTWNELIWKEEQERWLKENSLLKESPLSVLYKVSL